MVTTVLVANSSGPEQFQSDVKFGAFSDIHAEPYYDPAVSNLKYCQWNHVGRDQRFGDDVKEFISSDYAPLGRFFCNPPQRLFWSMLEKIGSLEKNLDVLFVTGDFIGHENNNERNGSEPGAPCCDNYSHEKYQTVMSVHRNLSVMFYLQLPNTLIIPTFGNNDFDIDDEPANETSKAEFYGRMFSMWFEKNPTNAARMNLTMMRPTFMHGGYYRVDINRNLSVLALNTVMYLFKNIGMKE